MNATNLLLSSTVFFRHGDFIPAYEFTHYPCEIDQIYIEGLDENNLYMISDNLYFYEDEPIFILNPKYTNFELFDKNTEEKVGELNIRWKTDECELESSIEYLTKEGYTGIVAPDIIDVELHEKANILENVYALDEGKDISHTLQQEKVNIDIPGTYVTTVTAEAKEGNLEKDIIIRVNEETNNEINNELGNGLSWLVTIIIAAAILFIVYLFVK